MGVVVGTGVGAGVGGEGAVGEGVGDGLADAWAWPDADGFGDPEDPAPATGVPPSRPTPAASMPMPPPTATATAIAATTMDLPIVDRPRSMDPSLVVTRRRIADERVRDDVALRWPPSTEGAFMTEPTKPKVTPARVKTSGAAPRSRSKTPTKAASKPGSTPAATGMHRVDRVEIDQGGADRVEATSVSITQGGIGTADAQTIDIRQGGIGRANATDIAVSAGGIGFARGERVSLEMGGVGAAIGDDVRVTQSMSGLVAARGEATIDQSLVSALIADRVTIRQPSAVLVLIARQVDGTVRPLLDWRGAAVAGAVLGLVVGLFRLGRR